MKRSELKLMAAEEALTEAKKAHEETITALLLSRKRGLNVDECNRKEYRARLALMEAESNLRKVRESVAQENAISDAEADKLGDYFAGNPSGWEVDTETLTDEDEALIDALVAGLD